MTVKELISYLKEYEPDMEIRICSNGLHAWPIRTKDFEIMDVDPNCNKLVDDWEGGETMLVIT